MSAPTAMKTMYNGAAVPLASIPELQIESFLQEICNAVASSWRISAFFGIPAGEETQLYCILSSPDDGMLAASRSSCGRTFPSITPSCSQAALFEREIAEQCGVVPLGHPWFKPLRFQRSWNMNDAWGRPGEEALLPCAMDYYRVEGEEVHEVAVGPVHAGIIEPGHFRFQCHGEVVFHLEIAHGYQHREIERGLIGAPHPGTICQMETIAGDTTVGHTWAYAQIMEALGGGRVPAKGEVLRGIALELERLANHTGDLGAIAGDVGYLPTASFCGRIRGDFLNMSAVLCGSRFSRGLVRPGGTGFDCSSSQAEELLGRLARAREDLINATDLIWSTPSVLGRLENTGTVSMENAVALGLRGPAARACGINQDARQDFPWGIFQMSHLPVVTAYSGDVCARTLIRRLEAEKSLDFVEEQLRQLPGGGHRNTVAAPGAEQLSVAITEGWRGEICHVAITDATGHFLRYKVVDPSFFNWQGLALALRNEQISDFPLCNKSFNLSYCGMDL